MPKVKVKLIKGPNFQLAEQKAYCVLHDILFNKTSEFVKEANKEKVI